MPLEVPANQIEARDKLVVALREITDGKIFLEAERARLTRALATIKVCISMTRMWILWLSERNFY
jgi:hypothetical protein